MTACIPGREFAFTVSGPGERILNSWRYQLEPSVGGTDVNESFALPETLATRLYWLIVGRARGRTNENGMQATLERVKTVVESNGHAG